MDIGNLSDWFITGGVAAAVVTALIKAATDLYKWNNSRKKVFSDQFKRRAEVYRLMNKILQETHAKRVMILKTQNGGGKPRTGAHIYASVLYEDFTLPFHSVLNDYQRIRVDKEYISILQNIAQDERGRESIIVKDMPLSLLRSIYEKEGVAMSQIFYLAEGKNAFYYMSVATNDEGMNEMASDAEQLSIRITVDQLRQIFKKETK